MKGGEFATATRCSASDHIAFIYEKALAGVPITAIAQMLRVSAGEVRALAPPVPPRISYGDAPVDYTPPAIPRRVQRIIDDVAGAYGLTAVDLTGDRKVRHFIAPRHEAFWRVRNETGFSFPQIGKFFGGRDHTSIMHGVRKHEALLRAEAPFVAVSENVLTEVVP